MAATTQQSLEKIDNGYKLFSQQDNGLGYALETTSIFDEGFKIVGTESKWTDEDDNTGTIKVDIQTTETTTVETTVWSTTWEGVESSGTTVYTYDSDGAFVGGTETTDDGVTTTFDASWNVVSRSKATTGLLQLDEADGTAYELFGDAYYEVTQHSWDDGFDTTYFDADGEKLGQSNTWSDEWERWDGKTVVNTGTGFQDRGGAWLGSEWEEKDSVTEEVLNSGWNSQSIEKVSFDWDGDGTVETEEEDREVRVQSGSNTWTWEDANGDLQRNTDTYTDYYANNDSWNFLGGVRVDSNGLETKYDSNWNVISQGLGAGAIEGLEQLKVTDGIAYELYGAAYYQVTQHSWDDGFDTTYFDADGKKVGQSNTWSNEWERWDGKTVVNTGTGYNDADWGWLGSEWEEKDSVTEEVLSSGWNSQSIEKVSFDWDGDGTVETEEEDREVRVQSGSNTWTWEDADGESYSNSDTYTDYYEYNEDDPYSWNFLGGVRVDSNGLETKYDSNWNVISQGLGAGAIEGLEQLKVTDGIAYELYGAAYYQVTQHSWDDGFDTTYFDADGKKVGQSNTWSNEWERWDGKTVVNTGTGYNDADWGWLGSEWEEKDSVTEEVLSSGWNSQSIEKVSFDWDGDGTVETEEEDREVRVQSGSNTWTWEDADGESYSNSDTYTDYYEYNEDDPYSWNFLGGVRVDSNGLETKYDSNWNVISQGLGAGAIEGLEQLKVTDGIAYELYGAAYYQVTQHSWDDGFDTTYFDADGKKVGQSNTWTNEYERWDGKTVVNTGTGYNDADWGWLGSEWEEKDSDTEEVLNSGWNSQSIEKVSFDWDGDGTVETEEEDREVRVQSGSNTWTWEDADGESYSNSDTYTDYYEYNEDDPYSWNFLGGVRVDSNGLETKYDSNWNVISQGLGAGAIEGLEQLKVTDGIAYELYGAAYYQVTQHSWDDGFDTTYFDADGKKVGQSNTWTNEYERWDGKTVVNTGTGYNDADWGWLGSEWEEKDSDTEEVLNSGWNSQSIEKVSFDWDGDGTVETEEEDREVRVQSGSNTWTWEDADGESYSNSDTYTDYYEYNEDDPYSWNFLGGVRVDSNGLETKYDSNWNVISQGLGAGAIEGLEQLKVTDGIAYELYGAAYYQVTQHSWDDGFDTTYFDDAGKKLGQSNTWSNEWERWDGKTVVNTGTGYNDADWGWLGSEWEEKDSDTEEVLNSGWNSQSIEKVSFDWDGDGTVETEEEDREVRVQSGSNTWTWEDANGDLQRNTDTYTDYYEYNEDDPYSWNFLGGVRVDSNGLETKYDSNWNVISQGLGAGAIEGLEQLKVTDGIAYELYGAAYYQVTQHSWDDGFDTTYFDADGKKVGQSNTWTNEYERWDGKTVVNTGTGYNDADWGWLGSEWEEKDSDTEEVLNSGWNSQSIEKVSFDWDGDGTVETEEEDREVRVESGSNTWMDDDGKLRSNSYKKYFEYDQLNPQSSKMLGEERTDSSGLTTKFDASGKPIRDGLDFTIQPVDNPVEGVIGVIKPTSYMSLFLVDNDSNGRPDVVVRKEYWGSHESRMVYALQITEAGWTARQVETLQFGEIIAGKPQSLVIPLEDGTVPMALDWQEPDSDGVVATGLLQEEPPGDKYLSVKLIDTGGDGTPDEARAESNDNHDPAVAIEVFKIVEWNTTADEPFVKLVAQQSDLPEAIISGTFVYGDDGETPVAVESSDLENLIAITDGWFYGGGEAGGEASGETVASDISGKTVYISDGQNNILEAFKIVLDPNPDDTLWATVSNQHMTGEFRDMDRNLIPDVIVALEGDIFGREQYFIDVENDVWTGYAANFIAFGDIGDSGLPESILIPNDAGPDVSIDLSWKGDGSITDGYPGDGSITDGYPGDGSITDGYPGDGSITDGYPGDGSITDGYPGDGSITDGYPISGANEPVATAAFENSYEKWDIEFFDTDADGQPDTMNLYIDILQYLDAEGNAQVDTNQGVDMWLEAEIVEWVSSGADAGMTLKTVNTSSDATAVIQGKVQYDGQGEISGFESLQLYTLLTGGDWDMASGQPYSSDV